jgi:putative hydrolase of the HAD superfamily
MYTPTWIFDLDDTLHDASVHIFPHINRAMQRYLETHLRVDAQEANTIRQTYWRQYGATLLGLMRHHNTNPRHFLRETHQFHKLENMVVFNRAVKAMLARLPGKKLLYSNAPTHYAEAVLDITGMTHLFDAVYTVESTRFQPKPSRKGFCLLLKAEKINPRHAIMVDDTLENLLTAKRLGMKTVWISRNTRQPPYVDARMASALTLPAFWRGRMQLP